MKIFKFFALCALMINLAFAESVSVKYAVKFGIFGEIGVANATLVKDEAKKTYEIALEAKTTGLTNSISGNRREYFHSKGKIVAGMLLPDIYTHEVNRNKKGKERISRKIFTFDHANSAVNLKRENGYKGEKMDISNEKLGYYATNDLLSLFFNFSIIASPICDVPAVPPKSYVTAFFSAITSATAFSSLFAASNSPR